jgi:Kdo2-lipid IVA lauroyltransferase/acyltransferase
LIFRHAIRTVFDRNTGVVRRGEYLILRFFCLFLRSLSHRGLLRFARSVADFSFYVLRVRRRIAEENLRQAFPDRSRTWIRNIARLSQHNMFIALFEFFYSEKLSAEEVKNMVELVNVDRIREVYRRNHGIIFMTGHFGNWEMLAEATMLHVDMSGVIIVKKQRNHFVDGLINGLRTRYTNEIVYMKESVREIVRTLGERGVVAMIADQSAPREAVYVPFFGREVATFAGPAYFALRTGAPILMALSFRQPDGTYRGVFEEVRTEDLEGPSKENVRELTARHTAVLEKYIRQHPDHWLWQHRRWKHVRPSDNTAGSTHVN